MKKRTGVFVCHCGINIAGTVDVEKVAKDLAQHPGVEQPLTQTTLWRWDFCAIISKIRWCGKFNSE